MAPQDLFLRNFKHKVLSFKAFDVTTHLSFELFGFYLIDSGEVKVEHHALSADDVNQVLDVL